MAKDLTKSLVEGQLRTRLKKHTKGLIYIRTLTNILDFDTYSEVTDAIKEDMQKIKDQLGINE